MGKASTRAQNKYIAKSYDRINLTIPKGQKSTVDALAAKHGQSVNGYINGLLRAAAGMTEAEWKGKEISDDD